MSKTTQITGQVVSCTNPHPVRGVKILLASAFLVPRRRLRMRRVYTIPADAPRMREFLAILAASRGQGNVNNDAGAGWITFTCDDELRILDLRPAAAHC
jgi:hypothetical protein